jgi:alpha-2-macroglobulin
VLQDPSEKSATEGANTNEAGQGEVQEYAISSWQDRLATGGNWHSDYADVREDRVLVYGTLTNEMAEYQYKIKANTAGVFTVSPVYAQSMYEPTLQAYSAVGAIQVE